MKEIYRDKIQVEDETKVKDIRDFFTLPIAQVLLGSSYCEIEIIVLTEEK